MKKRDFLKSVFTVSTAGMVGHIPLANGSPFWQTAKPISFVLYDERYSDARNFADCLSEYGASVLRTGDIVQLWYDSLAQKITAGTDRVAGLTTASDLMIIRECAREIGMRPLYEGSHDGRGSRSIFHVLDCSSLGMKVAYEIESASLRWPEVLARALNALDINVCDGEPVYAVTPRHRDHPGTLVSWLIA